MKLYFINNEQNQIFLGGNIEKLLDDFENDFQNAFHATFISSVPCSLKLQYSLPKFCQTYLCTWKFFSRNLMGWVKYSVQSINFGFIFIIVLILLCDLEREHGKLFVCREEFPFDETEILLMLISYLNQKPNQNWIKSDETLFHV